jgi:hypothetical protein
MKILIAVLASLAITLALPAFLKDCSGSALWGGNLNPETPAALTSAYNNLINIMQKSCAAPTVTQRAIQKWRSSDGVWHVSDEAGNAQPNSTTIVIESSLITRNEPPVIRSWVPMAILGFCASLSAVLFLLMWGIEYGRREPSPATEEPIEYKERQNAGEAVMFAHTTPHDILGIDARASLAEVEAAYEFQLGSYKEKLALEAHGEMTPEIKNKFLILRQAYEAMTRKKIDKYLAVVD